VTIIIITTTTTIIIIIIIIIIICILGVYVCTGCIWLRIRATGGLS
jgi:hypothetical protein